MTYASGGTVVPDGDLPVPDLELDPRGQPCRIVARLRLVRYDGDDVGSNWRWFIAVDGVAWDSGPRTLARGQLVATGETIHDRTISGGCGTLRIPVISVRAVEHDPFLNDMGFAVATTAIWCRDQASTQRVLVVVPVEERTLWNKLIPWLRRKTAILLFIIDISAACTA